MIRLACAIVIALAGCSQTHPAIAPDAVMPPIVDALGASSKIHHVVIIFQENRSVDNLFNGFPGAQTWRTGRDSHGRRVSLIAESLDAPYDVSHEHTAFVTERANGKINGFDLARSTCQAGKHCPPAYRRAYAYVPHSEIQPYWDMARSYTFADHMFQTNEGPSFPAHQYIISGTSTPSDGSTLRAASNAVQPGGGFTGGCDSPAGSIVLLIDASGNEKDSTYPCFDRLTLMDLLDRKSLSWRYYQAHTGAGLWMGPDAIEHLRNGKEFATHVVAPSSAVLSDIAQDRLADVVWVTPTAKESDHPGVTDGSGPSWVASVVNAIGESSYWPQTAIFVTWDDWGGWYDHVAPPQYNSYELGFRVPLVVISPYAKQHHVSHVQHEFGSILKFTEEVFGLNSMRTTDARSDDLSDCFDFNARPSRFKPIHAPLGKEYFLKQPESNEVVDY